MKKIILSVWLSLLITSVIIVPQVFAQTEGCPPNTLCNPLNPTNDPKGINSPQRLIGKVIDSILGVVGSLALLMFVYGGLIWMTSSGNQEKVKKGRDTLVWAAIGLVIIFSAYALTRVLITSVTG